MLTMWAKYAIYDAIDKIAGICAMSHISPYGPIDITVMIMISSIT